MSSPYTTQLQAGLGMIAETEVLLDIWRPGMNASQLNKEALASGEFPTMSARRLRNFVAECFAPRYLQNGASAANTLQQARNRFEKRELVQLMYIYTCRANDVLADFVREVYWPTYSAGRDYLSLDQSRSFIRRSSEEGKTTRPWSDSTIKRVSSYLIGACADFGLVERNRSRDRRIFPYRIEQRNSALLAYELHLSGRPDNQLLSDLDWALFGMDRLDVVDQLKRLALKGILLVQSAGEAIRIEWRYQTMEEVVYVIAES